jgi:hypothetical protein
VVDTLHCLWLNEGMTKLHLPHHPLPTGWFTDRDEAVACQHRDMFVCPDCAAKHADRVVEVYGRHYWAYDDAEFRELSAIVNR